MLQGKLEDKETGGKGKEVKWSPADYLDLLQVATIDMGYVGKEDIIIRLFQHIVIIRLLM